MLPFGAFLVLTGIKMMWFSEHQPDLEQNPLVRWLRGHMRITTGLHQEKFFVVQNGLRYGLAEIRFGISVDLHRLQNAVVGYL